MHDYWSVERSVIILATSDNLTILAECKSWYLDGTFKSSPQLIYQILIIHAELSLKAATFTSGWRSWGTSTTSGTKPSTKPSPQTRQLASSSNPLSTSGFGAWWCWQWSPPLMFLMHSTPSLTASQNPSTWILLTRLLRFKWYYVFGRYLWVWYYIFVLLLHY